MLRSLVGLLTPLVRLVDKVVPGRCRQETQLPQACNPPWPRTWASASAPRGQHMHHRPTGVVSSDHVPRAATSDEEVEAALAELTEHTGGKGWSGMGPAAQADLLVACKHLAIDNLEPICEDAAKYKGTHGAGLGDEMLVTLPVMLYLEDYEKLLRKGPQPPHRTRTEGDRTVCEVWPKGPDHLLFSGSYGEIYIKPGHKPTQGARFRSGHGKERPGVCCILAAGNHMFPAVRDVLQQLVVSNNLCVIKVNPCNDWIGAALGLVLRPLIDAGAVRIVYGAAAVAQKLIADDRVTALHMTGSMATYNAIVWGPGGPASGEQLVSKPFEAELGCVSPYIIVPGNKRWSQAELRYHAQMAISSKVMNSGHNCHSTELIVTCGSWPQRQEFVEALQWALDSISQRWPWYPGSQAKLDAFRKRFPAATEHGIPASDEVRSTHPFLFAAGLDAGSAQVDSENWSPTLQEVALNVPATAEGEVDVPAFLDAAVAFCNERCFGTLSCGLSVHPSARAAHDTAVRAAVADLRYGAVTVNTSASLAGISGVMPWGAWAAAGTPADIGTGNVLSHSGDFDHIEKGVVWARWMMAPTPLLFASNTNLDRTLVRLARYLKARGPVSETRVIMAALRSK